MSCSFKVASLCCTRPITRDTFCMAAVYFASASACSVASLTNSPSVGTLTMLPAPAGISLRMRAVGAYRVFSVNFAFRLEAGPASSILSVEQVLAQTAADRR